MPAYSGNGRSGQQGSRGVTGNAFISPRVAILIGNRKLQQIFGTAPWKAGSHRSRGIEDGYTTAETRGSRTNFGERISTSGSGRPANFQPHRRLDHQRPDTAH